MERKPRPPEKESEAVEAYLRSKKAVRQLHSLLCAVLSDSLCIRTRILKMNILFLCSLSYEVCLLLWCDRRRAKAIIDLKHSIQKSYDDIGVKREKTLQQQQQLEASRAKEREV